MKKKEKFNEISAVFFTGADLGHEDLLGKTPPTLALSNRPHPVQPLKP